MIEGESEEDERDKSQDLHINQSSQPMGATVPSTLGDMEDPLDKCPPDFEWARKHGEANKVKNLDARNLAGKDLQDEDLYCPWCRLPTKKAAPLYPLWTSILSLEDLGAGFPLYYQLKLFTIILYLLMFLIVGIAGIAINREKDRATQWDIGENPTYVVEMSIGNHGKSTHYYRRTSIIVELVLNIIFILVILLGSIVLRRLQNKVINEIDEK